MIVVPFEKLYHTEFFVSDTIAKAQNWATRKNIYDAIGKPKISHTLLWFKNCSARIVSPSGRVLEVEQNQMTYMPKGIEYRVEFFGTSPEQEDTLVVHFQMTDRAGNDLIPVTEPIVCIRNVRPSVAMDMESLAEECKKNIVCAPEVSSILYRLLSVICQKQKSYTTKSRFACIRAGIELLEEDSDKSLGEIARECGVSMCYFRRLFQEYSGETPMQFRQRHRIEKAKQLLLAEEYLSVGEIAQVLHFSDIYHFSKTFKKFCGVSPTQFLERENG